MFEVASLLEGQAQSAWALWSSIAGLSPAWSGGDAGREATPQPEAIPPLRAQLGLAAPAAGRAPQKYLIQNHSGLRVFYWADKVLHAAGAGRAKRLNPHWVPM